VPRASRKSREKGGTLGRVSEAAAKQKGKAEWLKLSDGDVVVLRVLDTGKDFKDAYVHRVPMENDEGKTYHADVPCLDQDETGTPCPGCKDDLDRRYKFWTNVIVRGDEDAKDKEEQKDRIMIWSGGITIAKRLDKLDARYGIGNRDIEVEREGSKMQDTKYEIEWADEEDVPLTVEDKKLAEKKHDLSRYTKAPEYDEFYVPVKERSKDDDDPGEASVKRGSAFKRRQKEEGEGRKTATRRSSSKKSSKPAGLSGFGKKSSDSSAKKTTVRRRRSR